MAFDFDGGVTCLAWTACKIGGAEVFQVFSDLVRGTSLGEPTIVRI